MSLTEKRCEMAQAHLCLEAKMHEFKYFVRCKSSEYWDAMEDGGLEKTYRKDASGRRDNPLYGR